ncbi:MAG: hypothetical protein EBV07_00825 [Proteobacteria bacterium]|nr:hypothetical protein [Pseudomonadota bacterium]
MGYDVKVFSLNSSSTGAVELGARVVSKEGEYRIFPCIGNIRVDEGLAKNGDFLTKGYVCFFKNKNWEHHALFLAFGGVSDHYDYALLVWEDGHLFLKRGVPKFKNGLVFFFNGEEVKII